MGWTVLKVIDAWKWFAEAEQMFLASTALAERGHRIVVACQPESPAARRAREAGLEVHPLPGLRSPRLPTTPLANAFRLARLIRAIRPDIVHAYRSPPHVLAAAALRLAPSMMPALVRTRAGAQPLKRTPWNLRLYGRWTAGVFVSSEVVRADLLDAGLAPERVIRIPTCVDPRPLGAGDPDALRQRWGIPAEARVVGVLGRLAAVKGHHTVVEAAARLLQTHPDLHVVFVGPHAGPKDDPPRFADLPAARRLGTRLHLPGPVDHPGAALRAFDITVIASTGSEVVSRVLLEAMWLGRPVVATTVGVIPEIAVDAKTALLVPPEAPEAMAAALGRLLEDEALAHTLGRAAHHAVEAAHLPHHLSAALETAYGRIIASMPR